MIPANSAIVDKRYYLENLDNTSNNIVLIDYKPNYLKYKSNSLKDSIAVFSEIFIIKVGMRI